MRKHIENTAGKARRRLNIVKKLASPKWGAHKQTLRQLYMGTATHTNLATLDKVQNKAWRFISGAMKTTPTSACEIECNIEALDIRRDAAIVTTYERYQRHEHHPNKALFYTWRKMTQKQQSHLPRATTWLPEYNLPWSRKNIATVAPQPLYRTAYQPTLCPHLIAKSASKAYPAHILKSLAAETIARIQMQRAKTSVKHCNNYDAELKAIRSALQTIDDDCDNPNPLCVNNIVIFTDSVSNPSLAQMQHHKQPIFTDIFYI